MRKLFSAYLLLGISATVFSGCVSDALAGDREPAPVVNAIGRYWGVGYSAGYHARYESRSPLHRVAPASSSPRCRTLLPGASFSAGKHFFSDSPLMYGAAVPAPVNEPVSAPMVGRSILKPESSANVAAQRAPMANGLSTEQSQAVVAPRHSSPNPAPQLGNHAADVHATKQTRSSWLHQLLKPDAGPPVATDEDLLSPPSPSNLRSPADPR